MTRRERLERKAQRRREWADKAESRSNAAYKTAHTMADAIPFGQPILVGHHSEKRDRRYRDRIHNKFASAFADADLAKHHDSKADGIETQLDRSIFSDDANAIEALEQRIAQHEAKRESMRTINRLFRKGDRAGLAGLGLDLDKLQETVNTLQSWQDKQPYAKYELSNLGGRITADRKRLEYLKQTEARAAAAEASPNGITIEQCSNGYVRITFAEKPAREILNALRTAGFWWGGGSWSGKGEKMPACIADCNTSSVDSTTCINNCNTVKDSTEPEDMSHIHLETCAECDMPVGECQHTLEAPCANCGNSPQTCTCTA